MEDNRKFATFFADAPKGKKIGAVLSWIATVILLVALFVPGYQLRYQMKTEKGTFKDILITQDGEIMPSANCFCRTKNTIMVGMEQNRTPIINIP